MRTSMLIVPILFAIAAGAILPGIAAAAESTTGFVEWALGRAGEMDLRWSRMTGAGVAAASEAQDGTGTPAGHSPSSARIVSGTALSHSVITSRSFLHKVSTKAAFLPLSTRERNGAARGALRLESPAKARLSMPHSVRRPLNSSIQQKNFFRSFGTSVARPKLDSFGRTHRTEHMRSRGASRPSSRADRPRIL